MADSNVTLRYIRNPLVPQDEEGKVLYLTTELDKVAYQFDNLVLDPPLNTGVHNDLTGRDAADTHPTSSITGLDAQLLPFDGTSTGVVPDPVTPIGNVLSDTGAWVAQTPSGGGEANTYSTPALGEPLTMVKQGVNLPFKSLIAGSNVVLTPAPDSITVDVTLPTVDNDHAILINRSIADQHPIGAVTDLQDTLDSINTELGIQAGLIQDNTDFSTALSLVVDQNTTDIAANTLFSTNLAVVVNQNTDDIVILTEEITNVIKPQITTLQTDVQANTDFSAALSLVVDQNTTDIGTNATDISQNTDDITGLSLFVNGLADEQVRQENITHTATNYQMLVTDGLVVSNASANSITVTLPAAASVEGKEFKIKSLADGIFGTGYTTADGSTIDGVAGPRLLADNASVTLKSGGTIWYITGGYDV
jgi:hypothetical protein